MTGFRTRAALELVAVVVAFNMSAFPARAGEPAADSMAARPDDARTYALELFEQSKTLYDRGEFREAAALLERAHAAYQEPVLLYNLARAYQEAGELEKALDAYERYLAADPEVKDRAGIEQRIARLREELHSVENRDQVVPTPAALGATASHTTPSSSVPVDTRDAHDPNRPSKSILPWVVAGTGVVVLGSGAVLGVISNGHHTNAEEEANSARALAEQGKAEDFALAANIAFGVGGILLAVGTAWGIVVLASDPKPQPTKTRTSLTIGPASARFVMDF